MALKQYEPLTLEEAEDFIRGATWKSAQSTEDVAPHQYVVQKRGQRRDDFTEEEFWRMVELIKTEGRLELWTPPEEWVQRWGGKPMKNQYLYIGEFAYWFTCPYGAVPMLNREHVAVQEQNPTRTVLGETQRSQQRTKRRKQVKLRRSKQGVDDATRMRPAVDRISLGEAAIGVHPTASGGTARVLWLPVPGPKAQTHCHVVVYPPAKQRQLREPTQIARPASNRGVSR